MTVVVVSMAALAAGPLIHHFARAFRAALGALDGFVLVTVGGLVLVRLLPGAFKAAGPWAALSVLAGILAIGAVERLPARRGSTARTVAVLLAILGFALHELLDGVALSASTAGGHDHLLPIALVLHRLPIGLAVWWLVRPVHGARVAAAALLLVAGAILAGWQIGAGAMTIMSGREIGLLQGLAAGALLHVTVHRPGGPEAPSARWASGLGALLALGLMIMVAETDLAPGLPTGESAAGATFVALALESAPLLLAAYLVAGLVHELIPDASIGWLARGSRPAQAARGIALGLHIPVCSCGVLPRYRSLIMQGAPATAALALLTAAPMLGLDALLLSLPLLGRDLMLARVAAALVVAFTVALLVAPLAGAPRARVAAAPPHIHPPHGRLLSALRIGFGEVIDHTGPWLLAGLAAAAVLEPFLGRTTLGALPHAAQIPLAALLAVPVYVCASGGTPLVAVLIHKSVSPGAALAFLITGPAMSIATLNTLASLHGRRAAAGFALAIVGLAVGLGFAGDAVLATAVFPLHQVTAATGSRVQIAGLAVLSALLAASLVRQGPRGFLGQVLSVRGHDHAHEHGPADQDHHRAHHHHDPEHACHAHGAEEHGHAHD